MEKDLCMSAFEGGVLMRLNGINELEKAILKI